MTNAESAMLLLDISQALENNDVQKITELIPIMNNFNFAQNEESYAILRNFRQVLSKMITTNEASKVLIDNISIGPDFMKNTIVESLNWNYSQKHLESLENSDDQESYILFLIEEIKTKYQNKKIAKLSELLSFAIVNRLSDDIIQNIFQELENYNNLEKEKV